MNNPKYVKVDNELYEINTDFRVALECNEISMNSSISSYERGFAIIYKLFGEKGLNCKCQDKLLELAIKYLMLNRKFVPNKIKSSNYELDFRKCVNLIRSSFKFDYNYDPYEREYMHWYDFYHDLENLSTSEFGNCCVLNRVQSILNQDEKEVKDNKQRQELIEGKKELIEKYCITKEKEITKEQEESAETFYKSIGVI